MCSGFLQQCLEPLEGVLKQAGLTKDDIQKVRYLLIYLSRYNYVKIIITRRQASLLAIYEDNIMTYLKIYENMFCF